MLKVVYSRFGLKSQPGLFKSALINVCPSTLFHHLQEDIPEFVSSKSEEYTVVGLPDSHICPYVFNVVSCWEKGLSFSLYMYPRNLIMDVVLARGPWTEDSR